jgi:hypothetical protein
MAASANPAGMTSIKLLSEAAAGFQCFSVIAFSGRRTLIKGYQVGKKKQHEETAALRGEGAKCCAVSMFHKSPVVAATGDERDAAVHQGRFVHFCSCPTTM